VLFSGQQLLTDAFLAGVGEAPPDASPIDLSVSALRSAASFFPDDRRPYSRLRQTVIDSNPALQEREAHKLVGVGRAVAGALRGRGLDGLTAEVAAQTSVLVFGITFVQWIAAGEQRSFDDIASDVLREVGAVTRPLHRPGG
jgi:hypothetical protein